MQDEPSGLTPSTVQQTLREHWRVEAQEMTYAPVGFGSYHWRATGVDGRQWFVTANSLSENPVFDAPEVQANLAGLRAAFQASLDLHEAGMEFVVAPLPSVTGEVVVSVAPDWGLSVFPHVEGAAGVGGVWRSDEQRLNAARLVARLHAARSPRLLRRWEVPMPHRRGLEAALRDTGMPWSGGPYAEPCRECLADGAAVVRTALARYDALAAGVLAAGGSWVVTHGEPHASNFIGSPDGALHLIDWDTARLAPRERDLFVIAEDAPAVLDAYREVAGPVTPDPDALALFELRWPLADLALYVNRFRHPHTGSADDAKSWRGVENSIRELSKLI